MHRTRRSTPLRESPFAFTRPPRRRSLVEQMLGKPRADLAAEALKHLLTQRDPAHISGADISALMLEYDVVGPEGRDILVQMWRNVLSIFLTDDAFSDREIAYLEALREAFALTEEEVRRSEEAVVHPRYSVALRDALADARLSDDERAVLARLGDALRLPAAVQRDLHERSSRAVIGRMLDRSVADRRLSPEELEELASVARHLGMTPDFDTATEAMLDRYALFWRIENGDLPTVGVKNVALGDGESCFAEVPAELYESRGANESSTEAEGVVSVRIARGVYFRAGSASEERMNRTGLVRRDSGPVLITSRRILFIGSEGAVSFPLRDLSSYQVYADGIVLERRDRTGPFFTMEGDVELTAVILGAALARA